MTHLGIVHRHHTVTAHSLLQTHTFFRAFHVLNQQQTQQLGRLRYPLALGDVFIKRFLRPPAQLQQPVAIGYYLSEQRYASRPVVLVNAGLTLHAGGDIPLVSVGRRPLLQVPPLKFAQPTHQLHDPIG